MKVKNMNVSKPMRYLWLKTVEDVNLNVHCARCLKGEYNSNVQASTKRLKDLELPEKVHYLCGVAQPSCWEKNFHLAFMPAPGQTLFYEDNGVTITIEDAKRLPISTEYIDTLDDHASHKFYNTCRNWQFAHYFNSHLKA